MANQLSVRKQKRSAAGVLGTGRPPLEKIQALVALGYDQEQAEDLVGHYAGPPSPSNYFESLPAPDYPKGS